MENKVENQEKNFLILKLLKRNWLLMAIITVLVTLCFVAYSLAFTKPVYTASRAFILRTEILDGGTEMANGALAVDVLLPQIEDNFTSQKYNEMANKEYQKDDYVKYDNSTISRNGITFVYNEGSLIARLSYTDANAKVAIEKLKAVFNTANLFFADSDNQAFTIKLIPTDNSEYDYSRFVVTEESNISKFIIFGILSGIAISFIVILIKNSLDTTIKDKQELEEITGTNVLAIIDKI